MALESCGLGRSCNKLKTHLHYYNAYGHQTCRVVTYDKGLPLITSYDPLAMRSREVTMPMVTKRVRGLI